MFRLQSVMWETRLGARGDEVHTGPQGQAAARSGSSVCSGDEPRPAQGPGPPEQRSRREKQQRAQPTARHPQEDFLFIVIEDAYREIRHFAVHSLVALSMSTLPCNRHTLTSRTLHVPKLKPCAR